MLNSGIVEPTAANAATRETTADMKASRSVLPRLVTLVTRAVLCIEPRLSLVLNHPWASVWSLPGVRMSRDQEPRGGGSGAWSDRTGRDTDPGALSLLVYVRIQSFPLRAISEHGVSGAAMDQSNAAEDADLGVAQSEIFEGPGLSDVFQELLAVAGDTRSLHDEIFSEELAKALGIAGLVRLVVVEVELFEDRQIFGRLLGIAHFLLLLC